MCLCIVMCTQLLCDLAGQHVSPAAMRRYVLDCVRGELHQSVAAILACLAIVRCLHHPSCTVAQLQPKAPDSAPKS